MDSGFGSHKRWIVLRTRAQREAWALENIILKGFDAYLPRVLERQHQQRQKLAVAVPLFPTYMFCLVDRWRDLLSIFGVVGVVMRGTEPDFVPNRIIADIRARETDGLVVLPKPPQTIGANSQVRVTKGAFRDHIGIVAGMREHERCKVLIDFLGRKTDVLISKADLVLAA